MIPLDKISGGNIQLSSVVDGSEVFVLGELAKTKGRVLHIALDDAKMVGTARLLEFFFPEVEVVTFPAWDSIPYDRVSPNGDVVSRRIKALSRIVAQGDNKNQIVITTVNAAVQKILPKEVITDSSFVARVGDEVKRDELTSFLVNNGYINVGAASEHGEFSLRGSIIDIFPPGEKKGYRLDFFGDEIESIRKFDPLSQISGGKVDSIELVPASEVLLCDETAKNFRDKYRELFGAVTGADPLYEAVSEKRKYVGMENWLPLFYEKLNSIFDYMPDAIITNDHLVKEARIEREALIADSYKTRVEADNNPSLGSLKYNPLPPDMLYTSEKNWEELNVISFLSTAAPEGEKSCDLGYHATRDLAAESVTLKESAIDLLRKEVEEDKDSIKILACMTLGSKSRMELMLKEHEVPYTEIEGWDDRKKLRRKSERIGLVVLRAEKGFKAEGVMLITEQDVLGEKIFRLAKSKKKRSEKFLAEATNLSKGEVVVHKEHGIGRFEGLETLEVSGQAHDFILLIYEGDDKLYVPVENIDLITRYGASDEAATLDRLGGLSWQKRTAAVKKRVKLAAEELIKIAAEREIKKAKKFNIATGSYDEFCARFPYTETEDQMNSIEDVIGDLASGKPMDRLICGDVGFGKTEVALRAAFIVARPEEGQARGQVAIITPTTLLARQHYQTFKERFAGMDVEIRQLSRLVPAKEARKTKEMMLEGKVDIVIGTHALLSSDIKFKFLGLLIVDEEQRFGVKQKEKLKKLKSNVHVLTLTATPIPRTLQLSLSGIRDLSLMATPPVDRLAIRTYVMPFDPVVIREAILREHYRGGRTFYVCPRIKDVEEMEGKLKELVPEVKIVAAHGRMSGDELDEIMNSFYDGKYDVLLATTIIESGLDVASANTLIVHKADMYGLAQLYQIRGRVGRSKVRAYAYLTLPPKKMPTKQAMKRLEVMQKLDTLGAGFTLASHDMDIRGFGNLLGDEQSGQIREVGVELYQDMLREAIEIAKVTDEEEEKQEKKFSAKINIGTSVLIPEIYIPDISLRLSLYRRIANLENEEQVEAMAVELVDRFGEIPQEVENLLDVVKLKQICEKLGIEKLEAGPKGAVIDFYGDAFKNPEALIEFISKNADRFKVKANQTLALTNREWAENKERLKGVKEALRKIEKLAA